MPSLRKTLIVRNLEVQMSIGVHEHERRTTQRLLVSVEAEMDGSAEEGDRIARTMDYDAICDFIRALAREGHVDLQETVARRILDFLTGQAGVLEALVEMRKPDVFPDCEGVGVRLSWRR